MRQKLKIWDQGTVQLMGFMDTGGFESRKWTWLDSNYVAIASCERLKRCNECSSFRKMRKLERINFWIKLNFKNNYKIKFPPKIFLKTDFLYAMLAPRWPTVDCGRQRGAVLRVHRSSSLLRPDLVFHLIKSSAFPKPDFYLLATNWIWVCCECSVSEEIVHL